MSTVRTLVVDNFRGAMTRFLTGDINSGRCVDQNASGQNPFYSPGQLTWAEAPIQIDENSAVITDLIMAAKERLESGIMYVYAIGHTGRVYKIQVNDPTTFNPDYDNPVLLTTITSGTPTFTRGGFIDFFGATERIYIGHDKGVTRIDFDGTNETAITGTWTQNVPRPFVQFIGKLYIGNGTNLAEIDSTATVTSSAKLSPALPTNTNVLDIDMSPDGNYIHIVSSTTPPPDLTVTSQGATNSTNANSFIFKWNGIDTGITSFVTYPSFSLTANTLFQNYQYVFGFDQYGMAVYNPTEKLIAWPESTAILPNSVMSTGNLLIWFAPLYYAGVLELECVAWGSQDFEVGQPLGFWDLFFLNAKEPETDIIRSPLALPISNLGIGSSFNGFANNIYSTSKIYFSTLEASDSTTAYRFYKWSPNVSRFVTGGDLLEFPVYQTPNQMFSKKVSPKQVRIYGEPWAAGNSFSIDLIGSGGWDGVAGGGMPGGSITFTAGTNLTVGDDFAWFDPSCAPSYSLGVGITNLGLTRHVITKIEIDYTEGGK